MTWKSLLNWKKEQSCNSFFFTFRYNFFGVSSRVLAVIRDPFLQKQWLWGSIVHTTLFEHHTIGLSAVHGNWCIKISIPYKTSLLIVGRKVYLANIQVVWFLSTKLSSTISDNAEPTTFPSTKITNWPSGKIFDMMFSPVRTYHFRIRLYHWVLSSL
jgi:hypothetical protein